MGKNKTQAVDCELPSGGTRPFEPAGRVVVSYRMPRIPRLPVARRRNDEEEIP